MASPKTEVERRLEQLEIRQDRTEKAISTLTAWLVSAQTGFNQKDMEGINDILYGRTETTSEAGAPEAE